MAAAFGNAALSLSKGCEPAALALGREPAFRPMPLRIQAAYPERDLGFVFQPQRTRRSQRYWFGSFEISSRWLCALRVPVVKFFLLSSDFPPPSQKKPAIQFRLYSTGERRQRRRGEEKRFRLIIPKFYQKIPQPNSSSSPQISLLPLVKKSPKSTSGFILQERGGEGVDALTTTFSCTRKDKVSLFLPHP